MKPIPPKANTLDAKALELLRAHPSLTSPEFQHETGSWRLAACIGRLQGLDWPIVSVMILAPSETNPKRRIAKYFLSQTNELRDSTGGAI